MILKIFLAKKIPLLTAPWQGAVPQVVGFRF
jgi:hypothetical protein